MIAVVTLSPFRVPVSVSAPLVVATHDLKSVDATSPMRLSVPLSPGRLGPGITPANRSCHSWRMKKCHPESSRGAFPGFAEFAVTRLPCPATVPVMSDRYSIEFGFRGPSWLHNGDVVQAETSGVLVHVIVLLVRRVGLAGSGVAQEVLEARPVHYLDASFMDTLVRTRAHPTRDRKDSCRWFLEQHVK